METLSESEPDVEGRGRRRDHGEGVLDPHEEEEGEGEGAWDGVVTQDIDHVLDGPVHEGWFRWEDGVGLLAFVHACFEKAMVRVIWFWFWFCGHFWIFFFGLGASEGAGIGMVRISGHCVLAGVVGDLGCTGAYKL